MMEPLKSYSEIYKITCKSNGLCYMGQTRDFDRRKKEHLREHRGQDKYLFYNDMRKYGKDDFRFETIDKCKTTEANQRERYWIEKENTLRPNGYNYSKGGNSWAWKNPEEVAKKISKTRKGLHLKSSRLQKETLSKLVCGEGNPKAKLTWKDVKTIRSTYIFRKTKMQDMAKRFNVKLLTIQRILRDESWKSNTKTIRQFDSIHSKNFPKGTIVEHKKYGQCYVGGYLRDRLCLYDLATKSRLAQNARIEDCEKAEDLQ